MVGKGWLVMYRGEGWVGDVCGMEGSVGYGISSGLVDGEAVI